MKKKFALPSFIALISMTLVGTIASSLAWLSDKRDIEINSKVGGASEGAYFAYGDGSIESPYGIETARHLYNLAWLQYLGYFNKPKNNTITPVYFELNADINMTGWVLPPIGTTKYPFLGSLSGKTIVGTDEETGAPVYSDPHTILNLVVSNNYSQILDTNKLPSKVKALGEEKFTDVEIVGMFGVVGDLNSTIPSGVSYTQPAKSAADFYLNNATITSTASETLIGIVAGYVNGKLENIGVQDSNINESSWTDKSSQSHAISAVSNLDDEERGLQFENISDYGIVGFCEDDYKEELKTIKSDYYNTSIAHDAYNAHLEGDEDGWGGSIDMKTTYDGLHNAWNTYEDDSPSQPLGRKYKYPTTKTYVEDIDGNVVTNQYGDYDHEYSPSLTYNYYSYSQYADNAKTKQTANYTFAHRTSTDRFMYIYGKTDITLDDVVTVNSTTFPEAENCFYISYTDAYDKTHYLTKVSSTGIDDKEQSASATSWNLESNHIYTVENGVDYYYLRLNNGSLSLTSNVEDASNWTWNDSSNTFSTVSNNTTYYLFYESGWVVDTIPLTYYTFQNNNKYLATNGTSVVAANSATNAAKWYLDDDGYYYQLVDSTPYYLGATSSNVTFTTSKPSSDDKPSYTNSYLRSSYRILRTYYNYIYCNGNSVSIYNVRNDNPGNTYKMTRNSGGGGSATMYSIDRDTSAPNFQVRTPNQMSTEDFTLHTEDTYFPLRQETGTNYNATTTSNYYLMSRYKNATVYLTNSNGTVGHTFIKNNATLWTRNNSNNFTPNNGNGFLRYNDNTGNLVVDNTNTYRIATELSNGNYYLRISNATSYYVYFNGTNWTVSNGNAAYRSTTCQNQITINNSGEGPNGVPKDTNTGYIVGGANGGQTGADMQGNIRVSQYFGYDSSSTTSLDGLSKDSDNNVTMDTIYTIKNNNMTSTEIDLSHMDTYQKLSASKASLETVLSDDREWIYGLHFMRSEIEYGEGKSVYVPYAKVNGAEKTNYELPTNCIDFNLKEKGYINFIAGAYFPENNCFFTIKEIQRNESEGIDLIRPIKAIYSDGVNSHSYIYEYAEYDNSEGSTTKQFSKPFKLQNGVKKTLDGDDYVEYSSESSLPTGYDEEYELVFNMKWIDSSAELQSTTTSSTTTGYPYYFEVPMNVGEYAMGAPSFDGASGAYLMYLDIGANAKKIDRTIITEYWEEIESITSYAAGVGFVVAAGTSAVSDKNSFCVTIKDSYNSVLSFDRTAEGTATYSTSANVELAHRSFISVNTDNQGNSEEPNVDFTTTAYRRMTFYDYNSSSDSINKIVITDKKTGSGSWTRVSIKKWKNYDVVTNTGILDDGSEEKHVDIYYKVAGKWARLEDGEADITTVPISTTSNTTKILSFSCYYPGVGVITITSELKVSKVVDDETSITYVNFNPENNDGYIISATLTTEENEVIDITALCKINSVTFTDGNNVTYTFKINGTAVTAAGQEITINLTVGS